MAKQHSDNIEDRFREAAENISFPPNAEAWEKMEALLDKDKRRRPVFAWWMLLLFGLLVGGGYLTYQHFKDAPELSRAANESSLPSTKKADEIGGRQFGQRRGESEASRQTSDAVPVTGFNRDKQSPDVAMQNNSAGTEARGKSGRNINGRFQGSHTENFKNNPAGLKTGRLSDGTKTSEQKTLRTRSSSLTANSYNRPERNGKTASGSKSPVQVLTTGRKASGSSADNNPAEGNTGRKRSNIADAANTGTATKSADTVQIEINSDMPDKAADANNKSQDSASLKPATIQPVKPDSPLQKNAPGKITASIKKWQLGRGFNISIGARIDATDLHKISLHQFKQLAGGTIGYRFSNRLSLQTGFFVQKAVYYAGPEDYYVKPGSYLSMYRISKIDAVCQIYEIPLSIRYDLIIGKGLRVYALGGINSFYMKKENYRYHATGSSGYRMFDSTYRANKNYFSSAYFAGGVEKKITPAFSILAEPYAKLPLSGIGAGKIKLYSGGIQLMLRYQPQFIKRSPQK